MAGTKRIEAIRDICPIHRLLPTVSHLHTGKRNIQVSAHTLEGRYIRTEISPLHRQVVRMNDLFSARLASLLFILVMFAAIVSTAEEQPNVLMDWDEIQRVAVDITDKVKVLPGDILKSKTYRIGVDEIPKLPHPHKKCIAEKGWESFPNGAETPVRNFSEEDVNNFGQDIYAICYNLYAKLQMRVKKDILIFNVDTFKHYYVKTPTIDGRNFLWFDNDYYMKYEKDEEGKYPYSNLDVHALKNLVLYQGEGQHKTIVRQITEVDGYELIGGQTTIDNMGNVRRNKWMFMKRNLKISDFALVDIKGNVSKFTIPFPKYGIRWSGESSFYQIYPNVLLRDLNYGRWKGGKRMTDNPNDEMYSFPENVNPAVRHSELVVVNIETGQIVTRIDDMFSGRLVTPDTVVVPHVAHSGRLGHGMFRNGTFIGWIPYDTYIPASIYEYDRFAFMPVDNTIGDNAIFSLDFGAATLTKTTLRADIDLDAIGICSEYITQVFASKVHEIENTQARDIYITYNEKSGHRTVAYILEIPEGTTDVLNREHSYTIFDGRTLYIISRKNAWKVRVGE